jgi:hypothetical protein
LRKKRGKGEIIFLSSFLLFSSSSERSLVIPSERASASEGPAFVFIAQATQRCHPERARTRERGICFSFSSHKRRPILPPFKNKQVLRSRAYRALAQDDNARRSLSKKKEKEERGTGLYGAATIR